MTICPECKRKKIKLYEHHIIDWYLLRYLINVVGIKEQEAKNLRHKLKVDICYACHMKKHEWNVYHESYKFRRLRNIDDEIFVK